MEIKNRRQLQPWGCFLLLGIFMIQLFACTQKGKSLDVKSIAEQYYKVYQKKTDFERFMHFYADQVVLEDVVNGDKIFGKKALSNFFNWNHPALSQNDSAALIVESQVVEGNRVATKGYFTSFQWQKDTIEAMYFMTLLEFNDTGKITKQIDWINYPSNLVDYNNRKNANEWILHSVK